MLTKYQPRFKNFRFVSYDYNSDSGASSFVYQFDDDHRFVEKLQLPKGDLNGKEQAFDQALRLYFLLAGVSYYKAYPTDELLVEPFSIDDTQATFFDELYLNGLGEYLYENDLSPSVIGHFKAGDVDGIQIQNFETDGHLVPIGGGKDSIVTVELLKAINESLTLFRVNSRPWLQDQMKQSGQQSLQAKRQIDPLILELNQQDALNGHVPITAIITAASLLVAILHDKRFVTLSNESSANIPNTHYEGMDINHQYSKSLRFETALSNYISAYVTSSVSVYSLLRPFTELYITEMFVKHALVDYSRKWNSSNQNFKIGDMTDPEWDFRSPKTLSVYAMVAAFASRQQLDREFGQTNVLTDGSYSFAWRELLGLRKFKPFECVADIEEMRVAFDIIRGRGELSLSDELANAPDSDIDYRVFHVNHIPQDIEDKIKNQLNQTG